MTLVSSCLFHQWSFEPILTNTPPFVEEPKSTDTPPQQNIAQQYIFKGISPFDSATRLAYSPNPTRLKTNHWYLYPDDLELVIKKLTSMGRAVIAQLPSKPLDQLRRQGQAGDVYDPDYRLVAHKFPDGEEKLEAKSTS